MTKQQILDNIESMTPSITGAEDFIDGRCGDICDAITEIADSNVDIYYSNLMEWAGDNVSYIDDAISEFGWDGCGGTFYKAIQMGQLIQIEQELYSNLDELVICYALKHASNTIEDFNVFEDTDIDDFVDSISDLVRNIDNNDTFDDIEELVNDYIQDTILKKDEDEPEL